MLRNLLASLGLLLLSVRLLAGPGDTITVQTFTFGSPQQNQWFVFPPDSISFEKILMYYTLKCNPAQSPACGEWDYLTYTYLHQHTGIMDSLLKSRPVYVVDFQSPDTVRLSFTPTWEYQTSFEKRLTCLDTLSLDTFPVISLLTYPGPTFPSEGSPGARASFLWSAQELSMLGLSAGPLTGIRFQISNPGGDFERFRISMAATALDTLTPALLNSLAFTEVYHRRTQFPAQGWQSIPFTSPFVWDGISNLVIDLSFESNGGIASSFVSALTGSGKALTSDGMDGLLEFDGSDVIEIPVDSLANISQQVTLSFWRYGDPLLQPQNQSSFYAVNAQGNRVLNAHVPWSNGTVYWDAGWSSGNYDRINKAATVAEYEGSWSHWAFTKNTGTGTMNIFRNGQLWHSGSGMTRSMAGLVKFWIGGIVNASADRFEDAMLDEFSVWNTSLSAGQIQDLMFQKPDSASPLFQNLVAYYAFDEDSGDIVTDLSGNTQGARLFGQAQRLNHDEWQRLKDFRTVNYRPQLILERGSFVSVLDSSFVVDSVMAGMKSVLVFADSTHPNIATDTLHAWPPYLINTYDSLGNISFSSISQIDTVLINDTLFYYEPPFEIVNRYELGRFITPYGIGLDLGDGWTWVYDVTDFRPLLHDSVKLSAGNWQELLDMKFLMIEGTPPRDAVKVQNIWNGNFNLNNFDNAVAPKTVALDPSSSMWRLKSCVTGHQFDNATNCAEFCPKTHSVWVNDTMRYSWQILQECADNPLYPQGGTWIYDRAGWCPGMEGAIYNSELTPFIHGNSATIDYNSDLDPYGNYVTEIQLISYSEPNHQLDAAVTAIFSPNNWELRGRQNPICSRPEIEISNLGAQDITSLNIEYLFLGDTGSYMYHWTGQLKFLGKERIILPAMDFGSSIPGSGQFEVRVTNPNAGVDQYPFNDVMRSEFNLSPVYDKPVIIWFKTNYFGAENHYEVFDWQGNLVFSRSGFSNNTLYKDTLFLPEGCYEFVMHDSDDDGISFWANNDGSGYLRFYKVGGGLLKNFQPDFGKNIRFQFSYSSEVGIGELPETQELRVGPNPGQGRFFVFLPNFLPAEVRMDLYDNAGRWLWKNAWEGMAMEEILVDLSAFPGGSYQLITTIGKQRYSNSLIIRK